MNGVGWARARKLPASYRMGLFDVFVYCERRRSRRQGTQRNDSEPNTGKKKNCESESLTADGTHNTSGKQQNECRRGEVMGHARTTSQTSPGTHTHTHTHPMAETGKNRAPVGCAWGRRRTHAADPGRSFRAARCPWPAIRWDKANRDKPQNKTKAKLDVVLTIMARTERPRTCACARSTRTKV